MQGQSLLGDPRIKASISSAGAPYVLLVLAISPPLGNGGTLSVLPHCAVHRLRLVRRKCARTA